MLYKQDHSGLLPKKKKKCTKILSTQPHTPKPNKMPENKAFGSKTEVRTPNLPTDMSEFSELSKVIASNQNKGSLNILLQVTNRLQAKVTALRT